MRGGWGRSVLVVLGGGREVEAKCGGEETLFFFFSVTPSRKFHTPSAPPPLT